MLVLITVCSTELSVRDKSDEAAGHGIVSTAARQALEMSRMNTSVVLIEVEDWDTHSQKNARQSASNEDQR
ncbi:hypothetical protein TNCV_3588921 [Trichonephila clavipes]|nr:hypothetical protein TNCV_3588921 [Trichonephila clavipes]